MNDDKYSNSAWMIGVVIVSIFVIALIAAALS